MLSSPRVSHWYFPKTSAKCQHWQHRKSQQLQRREIHWKLGEHALPGGYGVYLFKLGHAWPAKLVIFGRQPLILQIEGVDHFEPDQT